MKQKIDYIARYFKLMSPIINREEINNIVKAQDELEITGAPEHGSHKLSIVKELETGFEYVQKQTKNQTETEKEFMMASFLNKVNPNHPKCKLVETNNGSVSILSRKQENTQDVEQFVRAGRTNELLEKKVIGLEDTLIADNILGKQSDTKLANMLVKDEGDTLVFSNIDHERANLPTFSLFNSGQRRYPTSAHELVSGIADLYEPSDDNRSGLAGDKRAKEFGEVATKVIKQEKIKSAYEKVANADIDSVYKKCSSLSQNSTFFGGKNNCNAYRQYFKEIQKEAADTVSKFDLK
ncbi:TPA: Dot/Icm T4SS effector RavW, partial [Legionella pneumophila]|nr:Dot/Icm T4SS effector RavW [Legionella pneumophila]